MQAAALLVQKGQMREGELNLFALAISAAAQKDIIVSHDIIVSYRVAAPVSLN